MTEIRKEVVRGRPLVYSRNGRAAPVNVSIACTVTSDISDAIERYWREHGGYGSSRSAMVRDLLVFALEAKGVIK